MLSNPLAVIGIFLMGASAGALVTYIRLKHLLQESGKAIDIRPEGPSTPAESKVRLDLKALIVGCDSEMISLFSHSLRAKGIEVRKCVLASAALEQLACEKVEAIVLDFDEIVNCQTILRNLPRPNEKLLVIAIASDNDSKETASRAGVTFVIERPLTRHRYRTFSERLTDGCCGTASDTSDWRSHCPSQFVGDQER